MDIPMTKVFQGPLPESGQIHQDEELPRPVPVLRRLNRSKSVFSLAQDFFRLRLNAPSEEISAEPEDGQSRPGSWNIFGSLRGSRNGDGSRSQRVRERSITPSRQSVDTRKYSTSKEVNGVDELDADDSETSQLRHRKSLHGLFGTVGKRYSVHGRQTAQPNVLRKRSGVGSCFGPSQNQGIISIQQPGPSPASVDVSQAIITTGWDETKAKNAEQDFRSDSHVALDALDALETARHDSPARDLAPCSPGSPNVNTTLTGLPHNPRTTLCQETWESRKAEAQIHFCRPVDSAGKPSAQERYAVIRNGDIGNLSPLPSPERHQVIESADYPNDAGLKRLARKQKTVSEGLDTDGLCYNEILAGLGSLMKIDIDPSFTARSQARDGRYKNLSIQSSRHEITASIQNLQDIQESIRRNAAKMSENLHLSADHGGRNRISSGSSATVSTGHVSQNSWIESDPFGAIGSTDPRDDIVNENEALPNEGVDLKNFFRFANSTQLEELNKYNLAVVEENRVSREHSDKPGTVQHETDKRQENEALPNKGVNLRNFFRFANSTQLEELNKYNLAVVEENRVSREHSDKPAEQSSTHSIISTSPLVCSKGKRSIQHSRMPRAMRATARNSSMGPFHIKFPQTEFRETRLQTYESKSEAIGNLFQNFGEYSDYILFDRDSSTLYPQAKGFIFRPVDIQFSNPKMECFWLPMQFGHFPDASLIPDLNLDLSATHHLLDCDVNSTQASDISETQSGVRASSNDSLLEMYFSTMEKEQLATEMATLKQSPARDSMHMPSQCLSSFQAEAPVSLQSVNLLSDMIEDGVITKPLELEYDVEQTKTWGDLGVDFLDKYAPKKDSNGKYRAEEATRNYLQAHGKLTSNDDLAIGLKRKSWSRDRDGSDDVSFLHIDDLAKYETSRAECLRLSKQYFRDSGYSEDDAGSVVPVDMAAWSVPVSSREANPEKQRGLSKDTKKEKLVAAIKNDTIIAPCASPAPPSEAEQAQASILPFIKPTEGAKSQRIVRTCSFERFEMENSFNPRVGSSKIIEGIAGRGYRTPYRAPLQEGNSNFERPRIILQNRAFSQADTEYEEEFGEPLQICGREEEDEKENEERYWRDFMLYG